MQDRLFIYTKDDVQEFWKICQKKHWPLITIEQTGKDYSEVSYDITDFKVDLYEVSEDIKRIYTAYINFFLIPYSDVSDMFESYYCFTIKVLNAHREFVGEGLHYFLLNKINRK